MSKLFTAGELAKIAGVSSRTIRFYDEKGILKPCGYSEAEYRLYDEEAILRLQQILMFKYVGFSLEEISRLMDPNEKIDVGSMLDKQMELMSRKREQIDRIIYALDKAKIRCMANQFDPEQFFRISRSCIIAMKAIGSITKQAGGRLRLTSVPEADFEMTVSRSRVDDFLVWLEK